MFKILDSSIIQNLILHMLSGQRLFHEKMKSSQVFVEGSVKTVPYTLGYKKRELSALSPLFLHLEDWGQNIENGLIPRYKCFFIHSSFWANSSEKAGNILSFVPGFNLFYGFLIRSFSLSAAVSFTGFLKYPHSQREIQLVFIWYSQVLWCQ